MRPGYYEGAYLEFQFHKGAIRTYVHVAEHTEDVNFNSIKVRLEQNEEEAWFDLRLFQFHKGAIRT